MSTVPKNTMGWSSFQWLAVLAIVVVPLVVGGAMIMSQRMAVKTAVNPPPDNQPADRRGRVLPPPPPFVDPNMNNLHSVVYGVENGVPVIKITAVPNGDELIIDASTGRLIETRPPAAPSTSKAGGGPR